MIVGSVAATAAAAVSSGHRVRLSSQEEGSSGVKPKTRQLHEGRANSIIMRRPTPAADPFFSTVVPVAVSLSPSPPQLPVSFRPRPFLSLSVSHRTYPRPPANYKLIVPNFDSGDAFFSMTYEFSQNTHTRTHSTYDNVCSPRSNDSTDGPAGKALFNGCSTTNSMYVAKQNIPPPRRRDSLRTVHGIRTK